MSDKLIPLVTVKVANDYYLYVFENGTYRYNTYDKDNFPSSHYKVVDGKVYYSHRDEQWYLSDSQAILTEAILKAIKICEEIESTLLGKIS